MQHGAVLSARQWRLGAGAVARHHPVQLRQGRALDYHWNEFLVPPVAAGPNILEFDTPLDIRNLRVATTGCDEIANHEPCSDAVVKGAPS